MQPRSWMAPDEEDAWWDFLKGEGVTLVDLYRMSDDEEDELVDRFRG